MFRKGVPCGESTIEGRVLQDILLGSWKSKSAAAVFHCVTS